MIETNFIISRVHMLLYVFEDSASNIIVSDKIQTNFQTNGQSDIVMNFQLISLSDSNRNFQNRIIKTHLDE